MTEHTPGPWSFYESPDVSKYAITSDGGFLDIADLPYNYPLVHPPPDVQLSNARLIAAAPDMEKALGELLREYDRLMTRAGVANSAYFRGFASGAHAALAKARGE